jgi:hypothetical protein
MCHTCVIYYERKKKGSRNEEFLVGAHHILRVVNIFCFLFLFQGFSSPSRHVRGLLNSVVLLQ